MFSSLLAIPRDFARHRYLIRQLSWRDIVGRYRGSLIGLLWSFITPFVLLAIYTMVFGVIFKSRWTGTAPQGGDGLAVGDSRSDFAMILFAGLILHGFLSETMTRSTGLVLGNTNLVKRVLFPLPVLAWTVVLPALFHAAIGFLILMGLYVGTHGLPPPTALLLPVVMAPMIVLAAGIVWFLSALGVFVRDIAQAMPPLTTILMFLSPIVFPLSAIPEGLRDWVFLNPLTIPVENVRAVLIWGHAPDWTQLAAYAAVALAAAWFGSYWFRRSQPAFADVL